MTQILVTRPEPEAQETAARLRAMGFAPLIAPALRIESRSVALPARRIQALLVTSGNAIRALPTGLAGTPLLAVGDATASRARAAGFWRVSSAGRDALALAALVPLCCEPDGAPLLLATGQGQGLALAGALRGRGFGVLRRIAYVARPERVLAPAAAAALQHGRVAAALFFSPASAQAFVAAFLATRAAPGGVAGVRAIAISPATAAALAPLPWASIRVASQPNQDELLACLT